MFGKGLLNGMWFTLKAFFGKKDTVEYPDVKISMTERYRGGVIKLDLQKCIACGMCAMACPNRAILLTTEKTADNKKKLATYHYLSGYCLYCNLCIEACPAKAIAWDKNYEITAYAKELLNYDCIARAVPASVSDGAEAKEGGIGLGG